ncbi:MAG: GWxTD domain-containing protein [Ignavibacteriae bacterium]|nr:GWxTD domain-containing protein [Ignavibacteriota bacterium]
MIHLVRVLTLALMLVALSSATNAQPKQPRDPFRISVDYSRFRGDDKNAYIEVYYSFPQRMLTHVPVPEGFKGGVDLTLTVLRKDSIVYADRSLVPSNTKDTSALTLNLISLSNFMVPEGEYLLKVVAKDANDQSRHDSVLMRLPVKAHPSEKLALSDIEFASTIRKGKEGSPFYKNTLEVIPNADGLYGKDQKCFFYAEAYNLQVGADQSDFTVKTSIHNAVGNEIVSRERPRKRSAESTVLVDNFEMESLRSGTYTLVIALQDSTKKVFASTGKKFFVYNSALGIDSSMLKLDPTIGLSTFASMDEKDLDSEFKWARWEAKEAEQDQYKKLEGVAAKRKFFADFWTKRPPGSRDEYLKRVAHANKSLTVMGREGFRTDRGRVYIMYGPPDDIERHPNEPGSKPYEVWQYNSIQGGVLFVFLQRQTSGDHELVHSTHRNELHDENWSRMAQAN